MPTSTKVSKQETATPMRAQESEADDAFARLKQKPVFIMERDDFVDDSFNKIVGYLSQNQYLQLDVDIDKTNKKIIFKHSLQELAAMLPELDDYLSIALARVKRYAYKKSGTTSASRFLGRQYYSLNKHFPSRDELDCFNQESEQFFSTITPFAPSKVNQEGKSADQILQQMIAENNVTSIGEVHTETAAKKILVDNMKAIKNLGVEVIYLEHVLFNTQKERFDEYFLSDGLMLPPDLLEYLAWLDRGFGIAAQDQFKPYSFTGLVLQAKRYGIRIIPIDTDSSYSIDCNMHSHRRAHRFQAMNYCAYQIYQNTIEDHQKAIFFVGSGHLSEQEGVPGITNIIGGQSLVVEDKKREESSIDDHPAAACGLVYLETDLSSEAKSLERDYLKALLGELSFDALDKEQTTEKKPSTMPQTILKLEALNKLCEAIKDISYPTLMKDVPFARINQEGELCIRFFKPHHPTTERLMSLIKDNYLPISIERGEIIFKKDILFDLPYRIQHFTDLIQTHTAKIKKQNREEINKISTAFTDNKSQLETYVNYYWSKTDDKRLAYNKIKNFQAKTPEELKNKIISLLELAAIPRTRTFYTAPYAETASFKKIVSQISQDDKLIELLCSYRGYSGNRPFDIKEAKWLLKNKKETARFGPLETKISEEGVFSIKTGQ